MEIKTDVLRVHVNANFISREAARLADELGQLLTNSVKTRLVQKRKVATAKTLQSIKMERVLDSASRGMFRRHVTGRTAWQNIQGGRRAGSKMPVRRVGNSFEPFPELVEWFTTFNIPRSAWFLIMRKIARDGIKPVDIRDAAVTAARPAMAAISKATAERLAKEFALRVENGTK